ncbi:MAG TPA: monofunctional biosynthetic peptidoglycan transglycosylase [Anaeromyxobacteraceae bacterium]|nr:monofunctional biosynthetic peptidoglycan transglycosylase [Anaeromyxobacteraceae bacterium]
MALLVPRRPLALLLVGLACAAALGAALWLTLPDPRAFALKAPRTTALVEQRRREAEAAGRAFRPRMSWVPLERVSPRLVAAVLASEDARFFGHGPFDWDAIQLAAEKDWEERRFARGASTITQQLAKNLYLGTEKSLWRKGREALIAVKMERSLRKRRILALYLNVAEWGDGVFGIEAGARARFGVSAAGLSTAQAALMAAMLPAPRRCDLHRPSRWLKRRSRHVLGLLLESGRIGPAESQAARAELDRLLGVAPAAAAAEPAVDDGADEPPDDDP